MSVQCLVTRLPSQQFALTNYAYVSPRTMEVLMSSAPRNCVTQSNGLLCQIKKLVLTLMPSKEIADRHIGLNTCHRDVCEIQTGEEVLITPFQMPKDNFIAGTIRAKVTTFIKPEKRITANIEQLEADCKDVFKGQVLSVNQLLSLKPPGNVLFKLTVLEIHPMNLTEMQIEQQKIYRGMVTEHTEFTFVAADDGRVNVHSKDGHHSNLFSAGFSFEELGIGGLDKEFTIMFRRAFASRIFPPSLIAGLGIPHVKGLLLHGPPGTGKTLIARQIGKALQAREPKVVSGPEILNKYVGQSEENIRNLFKDAEEEYRRMGDDSSLHTIIFDEIDAICKKRGTVSSSTGVNDGVVNQLLTKIDGVEALNNILVIGMTNRIDFIDEALLRPGRFEVQLEIGLPDLHGRMQIFRIHTDAIRKSNRLAADVDLAQLAERTKNFTGAEIQGLVKSASSFALFRNVDLKTLKATDMQSVEVRREDFEDALAEVKPAFGAQEDRLESYLQRGILSYSDDFDDLLHKCLTFSKHVSESEGPSILSLLLHGERGSGKTTLAAHVAKLSNFPFTRIIASNQFIGFNEREKCDSISKIFIDCYKSDLSLIILDNVERLIEFAPIGPRFSAAITQAILELTTSPPSNSSTRLFVIATTSRYDFLQQVDLANNFDLQFELPLVRGPEEVKTVLCARNEEQGDFPIEDIDKVCNSTLVYRAFAIKSLLSIIKMAPQFCDGGPINCEGFLRCMETHGVKARK